MFFLSRIANPVYDKLTFSRAAHVRNETALKCRRSSRQLNKSIQKTTATPLISEHVEPINPKVKFERKIDD
jgi:hypothetical protein